MQVVYLGGEPRTQVWRKAEWEGRKENMYKGCLTEVLSARGNRSSGPWGLSKAPCRMCHWMVSLQEVKLRQLSTTSVYLLVEGWPLGVNSLAFYGCICAGPRGLWKEPWTLKSESPIASACIATLVISMLLSLHWYKGTGDVDQGRKHICFRQNSSHKCQLIAQFGVDDQEIHWLAQKQEPILPHTCHTFMLWWRYQSISAENSLKEKGQTDSKI